jgi:hypothetical protein
MLAYLPSSVTDGRAIDSDDEVLILLSYVPPLPISLFIFNLPRRLMAVADALLDMVNFGLLLLPASHITHHSALV